MADAQTLLKSVFGYDEFRPGQEEIVASVARGEDVLAILPTGGGKSLCYQLPALMRGGVTVVISPLIALMRDQVRALRQAGVVAGALTSGNTEAETAEVYNAANEGRLKLLYLAPERLGSSGMTAFLDRIGVSMIAVDEAHCVSQWGHDFRPDYLRIGDLRRDLDLPLSAFTATADAETRAEIVSRLFGGVSPRTFLRGFDRPNLTLAFKVKDQPRRQILDFALARRGQSGIVYCSTRNKTEQLAEALKEAGLSATAYHGGMEAEARRRVEERFQTEDALIVTATVAFGMGVDKPDIRWVAQADLPKSIEAYYQEIGRGGRDGLPADTLTLYGPEDIRFRRQQIDEGSAPLDRKRADHVRLNALLGLAEATGCRRQVLLSYFGEKSEPCGNCDLCADPPECFDATEPVRMALSAALRTDESYGAQHLIDIVTGTTTPKVMEKGHDALPTFGVGKRWPKRDWQAIFRQMMARDLLRPDPERHGALRMTDAAIPVLKGLEQVTLRKDTIIASRKGPVVRALVSDEDAGLLSALKAKRRALADAQGAPPYIVFNDRTLIEMAEKRPQSLDEMARISGVGATKLDRYGEAFLSVILGASAPAQHPARRKLAGGKGAPLYDQLQAAQLELMRGEDGTQKPLSLSSSLLAQVAKALPHQLPSLLDARQYERFGQRFREILEQG